MILSSNLIHENSAVDIDGNAKYHDDDKDEDDVYYSFEDDNFLRFLFCSFQRKKQNQNVKGEHSFRSCYYDKGKN